MVSVEHRVRIQSEVECRVIGLAISFSQTKKTWKEYAKSLDHWLSYYLDVHSREMPRMPSWHLPKVTPILIKDKS